MEKKDRLTRIMFVCMGNICRSPLAEGVFRHQAREAGVLDQFYIASSGTGGWHAGQRPDKRMDQVAQKNGVSMEGQYAQQFEYGDFDEYDLILVMDKDNLHNVKQMDPAGKHEAKVKLFRSFDPEPGDMQVPDPYYGGPRGFDDVYQMVDRTSGALLTHLLDD
ncbi:MAG: low molecular weight protein-tyrosine-phosphatase [Rhodothermales bacterium]